ncbi:hypothetical protein DFJ58DRAFT_843537 [Suillus subalutaceus]|uniref:uncharacterized protein n=1 Tax=Suillus subalutaceus TaxID=48586 RepID=UPI001B878BB5|nr:uncharacterized protein DFJ58DRAFT_843537 [Suillus subalutaceus]KAG1846217.1 hypothetical protein DFJ58DRAFT_843537 [Suillus subalutaceus]
MAVARVRPLCRGCHVLAVIYSSLTHSSCGDCLTRVLVGCAVGLVMLFVIWVVWDIRTAWWLYPITVSIRRCITVSLAKFCISRPSLEEGALMPLDNDFEAAGADSD